MPANQESLGWGKVTDDGVEIWDAEPVFQGPQVTFFDWAKLLFYPKKWMLYRWITKAQKTQKTQKTLFRILDVGCGTGATVIDLKKMFGEEAEVVGVDVVKMQIELAEKKFQKYGVNAKVLWYDGARLPFPDQSFDAIYTSDVLGHVPNVPAWLTELNRVLKSGGSLAMFSESKLGKHAFIRNYLFTRGLNVDPHAEFHISLFAKSQLRSMLHDSCFMIHGMYTAFWASFLVHPDEFYEKLQTSSQFPILRFINKVLYVIKKKTHPLSTAAAELYGLVEMLVVGKWVQAQGYVILGRKQGRNSLKLVETP